MNVDRLTRLAALLDRVRRQRRDFVMRRWVCGTSACALGWAALEPAFQVEGLAIRNFGGAGVPVFNRELGYNAGADFFDVSHENSLWLFDPEQYTENREYWAKIPAADVAARVRELLATGETA